MPNWVIEDTTSDDEAPAVTKGSGENKSVLPHGDHAVDRAQQASSASPGSVAVDMKAVPERQESDGSLKQQGASLDFINLCYDVYPIGDDGKPFQKRLLTNVSAYCHPGMMVALMVMLCRSFSLFLLSRYCTPS